jgi:hypothetical protein
MTFAHSRAEVSPVTAGALRHALPRLNDSIRSAGRIAGRHFCEGSTK